MSLYTSLTSSLLLSVKKSPLDFHYALLNEKLTESASTQTLRTTQYKVVLLVRNYKKLTPDICSTDYLVGIIGHTK